MVLTGPRSAGLRFGSRNAPATTAAAPTTSASAAAACEDVAELKSSLEALTKVKPAQDGVAALKTAIANVKTSLDAAEASASPVLQPSVQQVKTAFADLQTAASGVTADNFKQKAPSIASAMRQVVTATQALSSALTQLPWELTEAPLPAGREMTRTRARALANV